MVLARQPRNPNPVSQHAGPPDLRARLHPHPHQDPLPRRRPNSARNDRAHRRRNPLTRNQEPHAREPNLDRLGYGNTINRLPPRAETPPRINAAPRLAVETAPGDDHRDAHNGLRRMASREAGGPEVWGQ